MPSRGNARTRAGPGRHNVTASQFYERDENGILVSRRKWLTCLKCDRRIYTVPEIRFCRKCGKTNDDSDDEDKRPYRTPTEWGNYDDGD